jgi:hypothetical protein
MMRRRRNKADGEGSQWGYVHKESKVRAIGIKEELNN